MEDHAADRRRLFGDQHLAALEDMLVLGAHVLVQERKQFERRAANRPRFQPKLLVHLAERFVVQHDAHIPVDDVHDVGQRVDGHAQHGLRGEQRDFCALALVDLAL